MHHSQEEGYSVFSDKENSASRTIAPESGAEMKTAEQEEMCKSRHQHEATVKAKGLGDVCIDSGLFLRLGVEEGGGQ